MHHIHLEKHALGLAECPRIEIEKENYWLCAVTLWVTTLLFATSICPLGIEIPVGIKFDHILYMWMSEELNKMIANTVACL